MKNILIKTEDLCKSFTCEKNTINVIKNVNVEIYEGDFTIIMGTSGSGKSTFLYSISTMDRPTSGNVYFQGENISSIDENATIKYRRDNISFIFQSINLLPDLTTKENITYPAYLSMSKRKAEQKALQLLEKFDLMDQKEKYPSEMSGGQRQKIAILRALMKDSKVIFGDEPTGSLNSSAGNQILDLLTKLNKEGQSIVMVTHDIKACARGNRLLFLSDGRIEGDLNLGKYDVSEQHEREQIVFDYLKKYKW